MNRIQKLLINIHKMIFFIFINLFFKSFPILPLWNFKKSSINLLENDNKFSYTIFNSYDNYEIELRKEINKNDISGEIIHENKLYIKGKSKGKVEFENCNYLYDYENCINYICPMGRFNPYLINSNHMEEITKIKDLNMSHYNWSLKCYLKVKHYFLSLYLHNENNRNFALLYYNDNYFFLPKNNEILDFKLINNYYMYELIKVNNSIILDINKDFISDIHKIIMLDNNRYKELITAKNYSQATFNYYSNDFYYFTYNNLSDFSCGFSNKTIKDL